MITEGLDGRLAGRFVVKHVFSVADHVQTIHPRRISLRDYELIVAQPGGNLLRFNPNEENGSANDLLVRLEGNALLF